MRRPWCRALTEGLQVCLAGLLLGLLANFLSPRGLSLTRDYFPSAPLPSLPPDTGATKPPPEILPSEDGAARASIQRLTALGISTVSREEVLALFEDERYAMELILFVDARDDRHFLEGHISGARQFDHYRLEDYLETILPLCQVAERVVVYCNGGDCEDSEFAAMDLLEFGVGADKLSVYPGGFSDWQAAGLPVESAMEGNGGSHE